MVGLGGEEVTVAARGSTAASGHERGTLIFFDLKRERPGDGESEMERRDREMGEAE
jgi:hypothetical protein